MLLELPLVALQGGDRCHRGAAVGHNAVPERQGSSGLSHCSASNGSHGTRMWPCVCIYMHAHMGRTMSVQVHACAGACMQVCVHKQLCAHRDAHARVHLYTHVCMCMHTHEAHPCLHGTLVHRYVCTKHGCTHAQPVCLLVVHRCACTAPHTARLQQPSALKSRGNFSWFCWRTGLGVGAAAAGTAHPRRR